MPTFRRSRRSPQDDRRLLRAHPWAANILRLLSKARNCAPELYSVLRMAFVLVGDLSEITIKVEISHDFFVPRSLRADLARTERGESSWIGGVLRSAGGALIRAHYIPEKYRVDTRLDEALSQANVTWPCLVNNLHRFGLIDPLVYAVIEATESHPLANRISVQVDFENTEERPYEVTLALEYGEQRHSLLITRTKHTGKLDPSRFTEHWVVREPTDEFSEALSNLITEFVNQVVP